MSSSTDHMRPLPSYQALQSRALVSYGAAVLLPVLTLLLRLTFWEYFPFLPFGTFIPSVAILAVFGAVGPAVMASVLSAVFGLAILSTPWPFGPLSLPVWVGLGTYAIVCAILIVSARQAAKMADRALEAVTMEAAARESVLEAKLEAAELATARGVAEGRLEQVTDALPVLISQVGSDGRFEFVNKAYEEWFDCSRNDLKGRHLEEVLGPDLFPRMKPRLETVLSGTPVAFEEEALTASGERREMRGQYIPNIGPSGEVAGYFALIQDITASKRQAELLAQRERHLRAVMESVTDCFYAVDREWNITLFNRSAERYYGMTREEVLGRKLWDAFPAHLGSVFEEKLQHVMKDRVPVTFEARSVIFPDRFIEMRVSPKEGSGIAVSFSDITCRKAQEHQRELLIHELNHRVKNTLAVVQSIAVQSLRDGRVPQETRSAFEGRLMALAAAHDLLTRESWESAQLRSLIEAVLQPFDFEHRFEISGPDLRLRPSAAVSLTLTLHELATNATKYGALSNKTGLVSVTWAVSKGELPMFHLIWREQGGPEVAPPVRSGFGSRLIQRALAGELGGPVTVDFLPDGLVCSIEAPVANLGA